MAIQNINMKEFAQSFDVSNEDKLEYGEIYSPFSLIESMLDMFNKAVFSNKNAKWLDPGAGTGYFSMCLFSRLDIGLSEVICNKEERFNHIIKNMIHMVEIKHSNITVLRDMFGDDANITSADFLSMDMKMNYDYVIGNPPYNSHGMKKVPTDTKSDKKNDGKTVWTSFVRSSISLLKPYGKLCFIVPSIWLKPDKAGMYDYILSYKIEKLHCLTNTETNREFRGKAQTPTCYFLLSNEKTDHRIDIYDKNRQEYVDYEFNDGEPVPVFGASVVKKLRPYLCLAQPFPTRKTNLPKKSSKFSDVATKSYSYPNIRTCIVDNLQPRLIINYSDAPQAFSGKSKLVMAHKMYGFPYIDISGTFGISNRDNYVICDRTREDMDIMKAFLSTKTALYLFEATRYRMKYLEKYAFELIPDITQLTDFPEIINDDTIAEYFGFDELDRQNIKMLHKKDYIFTPMES
jgi:16S rRNA G966 N2-methylase RsmD